MTHITFLGTNTYPRVRESTCILVDVDQANKLLLDCCGGITRQLAGVGVSPTSINHVFLSHIHGDHTLGFAWLLMGNFVKRTVMGEKGGSPHVRVYALKDVFEGALQIAKIAFGKPLEALQTMIELEWVDISNANPIRISDSCVLEPFPVDHSVPTYGCKLTFEDSGKVVVFSADTRPIEGMSSIAKDAELLIHDCYVDQTKAGLANRLGHSTAREVGIIAASAGVRNLALVHLEDFYEDGGEGLLVSEAQSVFAGNAFVPNDLDRFTLTDCGGSKSL